MTWFYISAFCAHQLWRDGKEPWWYLLQAQYCGTFIDFDSRRSGVRLIPRLQQLHLTERQKEWERETVPMLASPTLHPNQMQCTSSSFLSSCFIHRLQAHYGCDAVVISQDGTRGCQCAVCQSAWRELKMRGGKEEEEEKEVCLNCSVTIMCNPIWSNIYFIQSEHNSKSKTKTNI